LDLATGTGMVAKELARKFKHVYATDQSEKMLQAAEKLPNIQYAQGVAEEIEFEDGSMDMITMGQAFHWVDHERFFREAKRVVKRDGTIAIIGYAFVMIDGHPEATKRIQHLGTVTLKRYWGMPYRAYNHEYLY
jgi:trans-aconitate 3-methyltransferase